jgi:hypothetical protein
MDDAKGDDGLYPIAILMCAPRMPSWCLPTHAALSAEAWSCVHAAMSSGTRTWHCV